MAVRQDLAAVVLAAGYSQRMGAFKPLLPFGSTTVIERVIAIAADRPTARTVTRSTREQTPGGTGNERTTRTFNR